jgi:hypothetical protein
MLSCQLSLHLPMQLGLLLQQQAGSQDEAIVVISIAIQWDVILSHFSEFWNYNPRL